MGNIRKIIFHGLKGRRAETKVILRILTCIYAFSFLFIVFQESFLKAKTESKYAILGPMEDFFMSGKFMIFLFLISAILIVYALNISMKKRKYRILMFRGMGATIGQLSVMGLVESMIIWMIAMIVGVFVGIAGSMFILWSGSHFFNWKMSFVVDWTYLFQSFLFTTVLFAGSVVVSTIYFSGGPIGSSMREDSGLLQREKMLVLKNVKPLGMVGICKRNKMFYQRKTYLRAAFSILMIMIMTLSLFGFAENYNLYKFWLGKESNRYLFHPPVLTDGISIESIEELEKMPEVLSVERGKFLNEGTMGMEKIHICWDGWKDDEYVTTHRKYTQTRDGMTSYDKEGDYFIITEIRGVSQEEDERLSRYENMEMEGAFDREKFNQGEECILFLTPYQLRDIGFSEVDYEPQFIWKNWEAHMDESKTIYTYEKDVDSVKPGDTIAVKTPQGNASVVVGGIVREISEPEDVIAVSEKFLDKIFEEDTSEIYNDIVIHTDPNADFEETEKKMGEFFHKLGKEEELTSEGLVFRQIEEQFVSDMFQKLTIIVVAGLLYILMMYQESIGYFDGERRRIGTFQSLGMSKRKMKKLYLLEGMADVILISIISFVVSTIWFIARLRSKTSFDSWNIFLKELEFNKESVELAIGAYLTAILFFVCIYLITTYLPIRKILKNEVMENIRNR